MKKAAALVAAGALVATPATASAKTMRRCAANPPNRIATHGTSCTQAHQTIGEFEHLYALSQTTQPGLLQNAHNRFWFQGRHWQVTLRGKRTGDKATEVTVLKVTGHSTEIDWTTRPYL